MDKSKKKITVKKLKETFEHLSTLPPNANHKPNWWIKHNRKGDYIILDAGIEQTRINKPLSIPRRDTLCDPRPDNDENDNDINSISNEIFQDYRTNNEAVTGNILVFEHQGTITTEPVINEDVDYAQEANEDGICEISNREILSWISANSNSDQNYLSLDVTSLLEKDRKQLSNVIQELIQTELTYVEHLEHGIVTYVDSFEAHVKDYPKLQGKKYHIFGNIERICALHKDELLPSLIACNFDITFIANLFYTFITKDHFYVYTLFGLSRPRAMEIMKKHKEFFNEITRQSKDTLGPNSFLMKPMQRLGRYKLFFGEMIEALAHNIDGIRNVKDVLSACCIVEKQLQRLLDNVNEALSLNDIQEEIEQRKSYLLGISLNLGEPVPKNDSVDYRLSLTCGVFDLLKQGKFRKMNVFTVYGSNVGRRFFGKVFLFEGTLLCTEFIDYTTKVRYRSHISLENIICVETVDKDTFKVITNNKKITFFNSSLFINDKWIELLLELIDKCNKQETNDDDSDHEWNMIEI